MTMNIYTNFLEIYKMALPIRRWNRDTRKWIDSGEGVIKGPPKRGSGTTQGGEDDKNAVICVMCNKRITKDQVEGGRRTFWNEGISNGKLILTGWIHQECLSFNSGIFQESYLP
tara:strand:- start:107 stop:448 length:342 start_codon:yes stop_codon:yes gene_type:complete